MESLNKGLMIDFSATILSVIFIGFMFAFFKVSGPIDYSSIILDSIIGFISYFVGLVLFLGKPRIVRMPSVIFSVILGSGIWVFYKIVKIIFIDWGYLSDHPGNFYERHVLTGLKAFFVFVPIFTVITLIFVALFRILGRLSDRKIGIE